MERLKYIKEALIESAYEHAKNLDSVDTCELGEVIDMIKDIEKTLYYCTMMHDMREAKEHEQHKDATSQPIQK